ncbi:MAG: hypothetical protein JNL98_15710 [Bryobacterales bacterium]|nr:hypothetical protein [Bryobacterales bacterium]
MASARILAVNTAASHENRIHSDEIASAYGFRGGLVPGVNVYGYMAVPVLSHYGEQWLDRGWMNFRLAAPYYDGETVLVETDGSHVAASDLEGNIRARGVTGIKDATVSFPVHAAGALPAHRPPTSEAELQRVLRAPLGSFEFCFEHDPEPQDLLSLSNELLVRNFVMTAWIHTASEVSNHHRALAGEPLEVRGSIDELYEKRGHNFLGASVTILNRRGQPVQSVKHTAIWRLRS